MFSHEKATARERQNVCPHVHQDIRSNDQKLWIPSASTQKNNCSVPIAPTPHATKTKRWHALYLTIALTGCYQKSSRFNRKKKIEMEGLLAKDWMNQGNSTEVLEKNLLDAAYHFTKPTTDKNYPELQIQSGVGKRIQETSMIMYPLTPLTHWLIRNGRPKTRNKLQVMNFSFWHGATTNAEQRTMALQLRPKMTDLDKDLEKKTLSKSRTQNTS